MNTNDTIMVPLSEDDLLDICYCMASELKNDMPVTDRDDEDFGGILRDWKEYAPKYVEMAQSCRHPARVIEDPDFAQRCFQMHEVTAERLERLIKFMPVNEVTNA